LDFAVFIFYLRNLLDLRMGFLLEK